VPRSTIGTVAETAIARLSPPGSSPSSRFIQPSRKA